MSAFIIMVPLCYLPVYSRNAQEDFFQYASMILVTAFVGNLWLGSFMALNVVLYIYNGASVGNSQILNIMFGCLAFMFSRYYFKTNKFETISKHLMVVVAVTLVFMAMQLFHVGWLFYPQDSSGQMYNDSMGDPVGFFGLKAANGTFLTIVWPVIAGLSPVIAGLLTIPIVLSQSSSVYLAFGSVVLFYTYQLHRKIFLYLLCLIPIVAGIFIFGDLRTDPQTFTSRFPVWHSNIEYALRHPWGYGPDSYRNYTPHKNFMFISDSKYNHAVSTKISETEDRLVYYSPSHDSVKVKQMENRLATEGIKKDEIQVWDNPHCQYIQLLFQYGILGFLLLLGLMREILVRFKSVTKDKELVIISACLLAYFITGLTHFPLEIARTGYLFMIILGAYYAKTDI
jgi:hypothetical protein